METYLITIAIGPVQSLIEAARRTRDLWTGSWILSECAKAAAKSLHESQPHNDDDEHSSCLIFPNPENPKRDLEDKGFDDEYANISNVIRAQIQAKDHKEVTCIAEQAKQAAQKRLYDIGQEALDNAKGLPLQEALWTSQIDNILETFAVWVKIEDNQYQSASKRLKALLLARKNSHNFANPLPPDGYRHRPKSSLDGAAESVIELHQRKGHEKQDRSKPSLYYKRRLGLANKEELDALGVMKRLSGKVEQFTPYPRICADDWLETLTTDQQNKLSECFIPFAKNWDEQTEGERVSTRVKGNKRIYDTLPFDGELLYDFRLQNAKGETGISDEEKNAFDTLAEILRDIDSAPVPYGVILKADGDHMGKLFGKAKDATQSRAISRGLHQLASDVRELVREHRGHAVYAGGDDILALLPLMHAIPCALALSTAFKNQMLKIIDKHDLQLDNPPSLSVGLAIGHFMQPLGHLRARAVRAEKLAKGDHLPKDQQRNSLGICLGLRSGPEVNWRCRWDDTESISALVAMLKAYRPSSSELSSRAGFAIRSIAIQFAWSKKADETISAMQQAELIRLLDNLKQKGGEEAISEDMIARLKQQAQHAGLASLADQLIIARWLSAKSQSDLGAME
ncbi:type III-B CRISPR-associated protein Cas10/Cmr2 [Marinomonas mediterranea]|uniref:type III-B CRISPR-associated protein Cas10/Cmr2 n=1 Tax=Marinomonas mediterranea TaxID=119864 RepID=UPI002348FA53|nr:type III-B CRISPR-associated protein Cas10/Cmr2 [Marinomonas mediterranea]WCN08280.1 type III-B CRISPR-associated protein Cas10/Cmr2 [Marinomonas mediterranea]